MDGWICISRKPRITKSDWMHVRSTVLEKSGKLLAPHNHHAMQLKIELILYLVDIYLQI
jgi:hypothetical protein